MGTPHLQDRGPILQYSVANSSQLGGRKPCVVRQVQWIEPELALGVIASDVDVRRLVTVPAVEVEPVWAGDVRDSWHRRAGSRTMAELRGSPVSNRRAE